MRGCTPTAFAAALAVALGRKVAPAPEASVHGGCINDCFRWRTASGPVFVKRTGADRAWVLEAERDGLERLRAVGAVHVPEALAFGSADDDVFLVLEWLELRAADAASDACLGTALARLHGEATGSAFGLERDNAIGGTLQPNAGCKDWIEFWRERRLRFQLELAARNGHDGKLQDRGRRLLERVGDFLQDQTPCALLHGDLWAGNRAMLGDGTPFVFDPAVYYGDPEADLAMTRLFGGFSRDFYAAYAAVRPERPGATRRCDLYNLYHVLNHLNLFGGGYRAQAEEMIDRLLT